MGRVEAVVHGFFLFTKSALVPRGFPRLDEPNYPLVLPRIPKKAVRQLPFSFVVLSK